MAQNEKIRTPDVVEILDSKVLTLQGHPVLSVSARENYDSVLTKIALQSLTSSEKAAFDNTHTVPSISNPVVLKDDLTYYIPQADLGQMKDSVATFSALPSTGNTTGDLRPVIDENTIYRWNGTDWLAFIRTGTLDHTQLINQNGDDNYRHLTLAEKSSLLTLSHTHANKPILDQIISAGSGEIITTAERLLFPTSGQKDALQGTSGTPSSSNKYVTSTDIRLNTTRNPYVTVGPPSSLASFTGIDYRPFSDALSAISGGSASVVKAIEVLPGTYTFGGVSFKWDNETDFLLFESFTPHTARLSFQTVNNHGVQILELSSNSGPVVVRGFIFDLNDLGTSGILSQRDNVIIENCIFRPGPIVSANQVGITVTGKNNIIRNCIFLNELAKGVSIQGENCRVEGCYFSLSSPNSLAVEMTSSGSNSIIDHNNFLSGKIWVKTSSYYNQISNNYFDLTNATILDEGYSTRYLENLPQERNQPFIGKKKTVGPFNSYADYRGGTDTPIREALADDLVTEIEILEGIYSISSQIIIPDGKSIRGVTQGSGLVLLTGSGISPSLIALESNTTIENLNIVNYNAPGIKADSVSNLKIERCFLNVDNDYCVSISSGTDGIILDSSFSGTNGVYLTQDTRIKLINCVLSLSSNPLASFSNTNCYIKGNKFLSTLAPVFDGDRYIIEANHFLGDLPTKINTVDSIWQANYPAPEANNIDGVDALNLDVNSYIEPVTDGAFRSYFANAGTIGFMETLNGMAATLPIKLPAKLDRTKPYSIDMWWTSNSSIGDVVWTATATFRDEINGIVGNSVTKSLTSSRSGQYIQTRACTFNNGTSTITCPAHPYSSLNVDEIYFTGTLPAEVTAYQIYYVRNAGINSFEISSTPTGSIISFTSTTSGTVTSLQTENKVTFDFTNLEYGLGGDKDPTNVSIIIERISSDPGDTLAMEAYLLGLQINLSRD